MCLGIEAQKQNPEVTHPSHFNRNHQTTLLSGCDHTHVKPFKGALLPHTLADAEEAQFPYASLPHGEKSLPGV